MRKNRKSNKRFLEERIRQEARYIISTGKTVRECAVKLNVSKSTLHKDVTERLSKIDIVLADEVNKILASNKKERHLRGGEATRKKYLLMRQNEEKLI